MAHRDKDRPDAVARADDAADDFTLVAQRPTAPAPRCRLGVGAYRRGMSEHQPGTSERPLRVAVVGSGPSGFYAAEHLQSREDAVVQVDMFDRLPTPFGLVRCGVPPSRVIETIIKDWGRYTKYHDCPRHSKPPREPDFYYVKQNIMAAAQYYLCDGGKRLEELYPDQSAIPVSPVEAEWDL